MPMYRVYDAKERVYVGHTYMDPHSATSDIYFGDHSWYEDYESDDRDLISYIEEHSPDGDYLDDSNLIIYRYWILQLKGT